jgi:uncharacterized protein (DUF1684 family)
MDGRVTRRSALGRIAALGLPCLILAGGCAGRTDLEPTSWLSWREERFNEVAGPNGWAALAGLHWLNSGASSIGTDPSCDIRLPEGTAPPRVGTVTRDGDSVVFEAEPRAGVTLKGAPVDRLVLKSDVGGSQDILHAGRLRFWLIARGDRRAIRVRDPESPVRRAIREIPVFGYSEAYRVRARFEPYDPPRTLTIADVTGGSSEEICPGAFVFELGGRLLRLDALEDADAGDLFVIFRDLTSGRQTYGGGRFLHVQRPRPGESIDLDFNRAYNPPCAFTAFATCPVPPRQNWLPVAVPAGERHKDNH